MVHSAQETSWPKAIRWLAASLKLRATLLRAIVTQADMEEVIKILLTQAKRGDMIAIRELLDRTLGKAGVPSTEEEFDKHVAFTLNIGPSPMRALPNDNREDQ